VSAGSSIKSTRQATYHFSRAVAAPFEDVMVRVVTALKSEGFGVLTDIDVQETLKKKLGVDFRKYRILGACNPSFAHQALQVEDKIGTMLPCNVIVQERDDGTIEVSAVDPIASMQAVGNPSLLDVARAVQTKLKVVITTF
jgi:uncharacterized protein (DUF302 family)